MAELLKGRADQGRNSQKRT